MKQVFILMLTMLILVGCEGKDMPIPSISVEDKKVPVVLGTHNWVAKGNGVDGVMVQPLELIKLNNIQPVVVSAGSQLQVDFEYQPLENSLKVQQWEDSKIAATVTSSKFTVPNEDGIYYYDVYAEWKEGHLSYAFAIEVK